MYEHSQLCTYLLLFFFLSATYLKLALKFKNAEKWYKVTPCYGIDVCKKRKFNEEKKKN